MALIFKCDICGSSFDKIEEIPNKMVLTNEDPRTLLGANRNTDKEENRHICPECYLAIRETMRRRASEGFEKMKGDDQNE